MSGTVVDVAALRAEIEAARRELAKLRERSDEINRAGLRQAGELTRLDDALRRSEAAILEAEGRAAAAAAPAPAQATTDDASVKALAAQVDALGRDLAALQGTVDTIVRSRAWRAVGWLSRVLRLVTGRPSQ